MEQPNLFILIKHPINHLMDSLNYLDPLEVHYLTHFNETDLVCCPTL